MPAPSMLTVIAVPGALVLDDRAAISNARRYIGREMSPRHNAEDLEGFYPPAQQQYPDDAAHRYLYKALKKGDLKACDEYTARRAGVAFEGRVKASKKGE